VIPTAFGLVAIAIATFLLFRGTPLSLLQFMMGCTLFSGSAAFIMTALGGSSVSPAHLALVFMAGRILLPGSGAYNAVAPAVRSNVFLAFYTLYSAATAFLLPRIFAGHIAVSPLRPIHIRSFFDTVPLAFTNQNVTTAVYLVGTLLAAICATVVARRPDSAERIVRTACLIAWVHVAFGVLGVALATFGLGHVLDIFRNGSYGQLEQSYNGMIRIAGVFPEASAYASYAFVWLVFTFECWMRDLQPRRTGPAAIALLTILVFSTSGAAYVSLAGYGVLLVVRFLVFRQNLRPAKAVRMLVAGVLAVVTILALLLLLPRLADQLGDMFRHMTVDKADSVSGRQRAFWAMQGLEAFRVSFGLGIGAGSFRSSSLFLAILGSTGVIGVAAFLAHLMAVFKPLRASTYLTSGDARQAAGSAASWTVLSLMIPASISAASPDPGLTFAVLGGLALGWRRLRVPQPRARPAARPRPDLARAHRPQASSRSSS
jgi:hypothetical protein